MLYLIEAEWHKCVSDLTIMSPGRQIAIIWTNAAILLIGPLGTKFNDIVFEIRKFPFKKMHLKMLSVK